MVKMSIQRCSMLLSHRNVNKFPSLKLSLQLLVNYKPFNGHRLYGCTNSSLCCRGYHQPESQHFDSCSSSQSKIPLHLSFKKHHTSTSPYFSSTLSKCKFFTNSSKYQDDYFSNHGHRRKAIFTHILNLLAGLGLSYAIYKSLINKSELSNLLTTARCYSQEPNIAKSEKQQSNCKQCAPLKPFHENSDQQKFGGEENEFGKISFQAAIEKAQKICMKRKEEVGSPGIVVCVSVDGKQVYAEGFGYADVENQIPLKPNSVLRIASISKAITAIIVAKAWEKGQIDLEKAVQHYVPSFPHKEFMGEKVEITVKQLLSHSSGIRHYKSDDDPVYAFDKRIAELIGVVSDASLQPFYKTGPGQAKTLSDNAAAENEVQKKKKKKAETSEMERNEYYLTKHYSTTKESLALFANDPLVARPGAKYVYTTFGYTLLAAVVEAALKSPFTTIMTKTLQQMGLRETYLDLNKPIIYNRARYYVKDSNGGVVNSHYVDNSYKWAGGGLLSTVEDIVKFGNILLYSAQHEDEDPGPPGFLKSSSILKFWTPQGINGASQTYGLGFSIRPANEHFGMCNYVGFGVGHTGAAVGVSSALFILPRQYSNKKSTNANSQELPGEVVRKEITTQAIKNTSSTDNQTASFSCKTKPDIVQERKVSVSENNLCVHTSKSGADQLPQGVVVCVMLNMMSVSAKDVAEDIARIFEKVDFTL